MTNGRGASRLRALTGLLAGGLVALAVALGVAGIVANRTGLAGPGSATLFWHGVAAITAVVAQRYADRHPGGDGTGAALAVAVLTVAVLAVGWLG